MIRSPEHQAIIDEIDTRTAAILGMSLQEMRDKEAKKIATKEAEASFRTTVNEFNGVLIYRQSIGGMMDTPANLSVDIDWPKEFRGESRWEFKSGIIKQLQGKRVTVIVHD